MKMVIGVDLGTSGVKGVIFDSDGKALASESDNYPLISSKKNWAEEDPLVWQKATLNMLRHLLDSFSKPKDEIVAIGLTGQMHGLVLLDKNNQVLRPALLWCDLRSEDVSAELIAKYGKGFFLKRTGNLPIASLTLAKLLWIKKYEPKIFSAIDKVMLPKDYIRYILTGKHQSELSDLSGTQFINFATKDYDEEIMHIIGLPRHVYPQIIASYDSGGNIKNSIAKELGLNPNVIVAGGASDQAANALGVGVIKNKEATISMGSSGVFLAVNDKFTFNNSGKSQTFMHVDGRSFLTIGVTQTCTTSLNWFTDTFYSEFSDKKIALSKINDDASESPIGSNGVIFLPYLMGERTPHLNANAKGVFFGLNTNVDRKDMARAVMEGVAYSIKDCALVVLKHQSINRIGIGGGGAKSPLWRQIVADTLGLKLDLSSVNESGCLGAAILAMIASGIYPSITKAVEIIFSNPKTFVVPNKENNLIYQENFLIYQGIYKQLKTLFR
ncbi:MAG: xylulokinase [Bacilli bacterium]|jgi:xylulokinase|nr:xylulokinase [Bacilli bacterium]